MCFGPDDDFLITRCCMAKFSDVFKVYQAGELTVVGFVGQSLPEYERVVRCRDLLVDFLQQHECRTLALDLTGIPFIPSGILGLLVSIRQIGIELLFYNPSPTVVDVLETTKLNNLIRIEYVKTGLAGNEG